MIENSNCHKLDFVTISFRIISKIQLRCFVNSSSRLVELYIPRKCSASNRIIKAKDHASVQINIVKVDENGRAIQGEFITYALSGFIRANGEADDSINRLAQQDGVLKNVWSFSR